MLWFPPPWVLWGGGAKMGDGAAGRPSPDAHPAQVEMEVTRFRGWREADGPTGHKGNYQGEVGGGFRKEPDVPGLGLKCTLQLLVRWGTGGGPGRKGPAPGPAGRCQGSLPLSWPSSLP